MTGLYRIQIFQCPEDRTETVRLTELFAVTIQATSITDAMVGFNKHRHVLFEGKTFDDYLEGCGEPYRYSVHVTPALVAPPVKG